MGKRRVQLAVTALAAVPLAAVLLAGCTAESGSSPTAGGSVSTTPAPPPSSPTPASPGPGATSPEPGPIRPSFTATPLPPTKTGAEQTLSGQVVEGVEPGCMLLRAAQGDFLLIVPARLDKSIVKAGARVVVRGRADPGIVTTCQQGTPFLVSEIRPG